jgi:2-polyprenyl-3-methyl-5-hydroxy-6-metoxy-1,4-benzoquinol methylase
MGKCWCTPGYELSPTTGLCSEPVLQVGNCDCEPSNHDRSFLTNFSWYLNNDMSEHGIRCTNLCRSNSQVGVPFSIPQEWNDNNVWKQLSFYKKELTVASERRHHNHLRERLDEFYDGYQNWTYLEGLNLGDVIEFGAGGYTQLRNIMENVKGVKVKSVVLVDPRVNDYKTIQACTYQSGKFTVSGVSYPTELSTSPVEEFDKGKPRRQFDTVICMNVLVYAQNAYKFLETLYGSVKPGGLLLFHDRWFNDVPKSSTCKMFGFLTNMIQIKKPVLDHFLSFFSTEPFLSTEQTRNQKLRSIQWCTNRDTEQGYWAAVRKPL